MLLEQHVECRIKCGQFGDYNLLQCFCFLCFIEERERREQGLVREKSREVSSHQIMTGHLDLRVSDYIMKAVCPFEGGVTQSK